jgi:Tfp pilus assembly protein PilN
VKAVNLIPSEQRAGGGPAAGESEGAAFMVLGLLAGLAVLALLYGIASHQVSERKEKVASVSAQAQTTQARANALTPYTSFKAMYEQRLNAVTELVNTRFDWAHAFHELGRVLPSDASLNSVKGTIASAAVATGAAAKPAAPAAPATAASAGATSTASAASAVTSATPPGSVPTFILAGCATSQAEVAQALQRLRLIDGVGDVTLQSSTKSTSAGGSSGGSGAGCPGKDPAFAMTVTFAALPTPPASSSGSGSLTQSTAATGTGAASSPATRVANAGGSQ